MVKTIEFEEKFPEINFDSDVATPSVNPYSVKLADSVLIASARNTTVDAVMAEMEAGVDPRAFLQASATGAIQNNNAAVVDNAVADGRDTLTQEELDQMRGAWRLGSMITPDVNILIEDSVRGEMHRTAAPRLMQLELELNKRTPIEDKGWIGATGSFLFDLGETLVTDPIQGLGGLLQGEEGTFFEGAQDMAALAERIAAAAYDYNMTDEEFNALVAESFDRIEDYGFFSDKNPQKLETFMGMILQYGRGSESNVLGTLQAVSAAGEILPQTALLRPVTVGAFAGLRAGASVVTSHAVAAMANRMAGISAGVGVNKVAPNSVQALASTLPKTHMPGVRLSMSGPNNQTLQKLEAHNHALQQISRINVGVAYDDAALRARAEEVANEVATGAGSQGNALLDIAHGEDFLGNPVITFSVGKEGGRPFIDQALAVDLAESLGGTVRQVTENGRTGWVVEAEAAVPTRGLPQASDLADLSYGGKLMSVAWRTTHHLNNILKTGEAGTAAIHESVLKGWKRARRAISRKEENQFNELYKSYNDNPMYQINTDTPITRAEFVADWISTYKEAPSRAVIEFFEHSEDLTTADYFLRANKPYRDAVNNGEIMLDMGDNAGQAGWNRARPHSSPNTKYYDVENKVYLSADEAKAQGFNTYKINSTSFFDENRNVVQYVATKGQRTRRIQHTDVLPFHRGAHRMYQTQGGFFLRQPTKLNTADGVVAGTPRTFMHVTTRVQAEKAATEFNTILDAARSGTLTDDVIRANTSWNPSVETVSEWDEFVKKYDIDLEEKIDFSADGDLTKFRGDQYFAGYDTESNAFIQTSSRNKRRGLVPLHGYGTDGAAATINFTEMAPKAFINSSNVYGYSAYNQASAEGLIKLAKDKGLLSNEAEVMDLMNRGHTLRAIERLRNGLTTKDPVASKLRTEASTIMTALGNEQPLAQAIQRHQHLLVEWAASKDMPKVQMVAEFFEGKVGATNVSNFLRSTAFNLKLGLFAMDQLWVQGSAIYGSGVISSSKIGVSGALKTFAELTPMRIMLSTPDSLRPDMAARLHKITGFDNADELMEWVTHLEYSGRLAVKGTAGEENVARGVGGGLREKLSDASRIAFNEGEKINRLYSMMLARAEAKAKYGANFSLKNKHIGQEMIGRSDILTQSMTNASSAAFQKDITALPFQFLTYQRNILEQIFSNKILSGSERRRLAVGFSALYGAAGIPGVGYVADRISFGMDTPTPDIIRYGALDAVVSGLTGVDTALSTRLGAGEGLFDLVASFREDPGWKVLGGPGVSVTYDTGKAVVNMIGAIASPQFHAVAGAELRSVLNNLSSASRFTKAAYVLKYGEYISSRTGELVLSDLSSEDAIAVALGIPLQEIDEIYRFGNIVRNKEEAAKAIRGDIGRWMNEWELAIAEGDLERARAIANTVDTVLGSLDPLQQRVVGDPFRSPDMQQKFAEKLFEIGKTNLALRTENKGTN